MTIRPSWARRRCSAVPGYGVMMWKVDVSRLCAITVLVKVAVPILVGTFRAHGAPAEPADAPEARVAAH